MKAPLTTPLRPRPSKRCVYILGAKGGMEFGAGKKTKSHLLKSAYIPFGSIRPTHRAVVFFLRRGTSGIHTRRPPPTALYDAQLRSRAVLNGRGDSVCIETARAAVVPVLGGPQGTAVRGGGPWYAAWVWQMFPIVEKRPNYGRGSRKQDGRTYII